MHDARNPRSERPGSKTDKREESLISCGMPRNRSVESQQNCCILGYVTSQEFKRWLAKQGCTFEPGRGGHLTVRHGDKVASLPMHGKGKELGTGLVNAIKKQLGLR
jgi:mRNA interferase HicA